MTTPPVTRHHSVDSPETVILKRQKTDSDIHHWYTISDKHYSGSPLTHSLDTNGRTSPLRRFRLAKESIYKTFGLIKDQLNSAQDTLKDFHSSERGEEQLTVLTEKSKGIEDILSRDHMKVVFFGRTSNGKSTVVNSLLRDKVLPTGIGHTTNCFCSVVGVEETEGYVLIPGDNERKNIKALQQLAHSLHKERLSANSLVNVYWPKEKCPLLQEDVEFVDSPGIDMNPDVDAWINDHCLNADVFVLVSNAESTLMNAEKSFFYRVSERLSRPNIFILNNRWDASAQEEPSMMKEVKQQHLENDIHFLTEQLQVTDSLTANDRVYFVSAKEVLTLRTRQGNDESDIGRGLADGYKARLMEFERFEKKFKECLSSSAIKTKFEQHHTRGMEIVTELDKLLENEEIQANENSLLIRSELQQTFSKLQELSDSGHQVYDVARETAVSMATKVESKVQSSMDNIIHHISNIVDEYKGTSEFDPTKSESYKNELYNYIDQHLQQEMVKLCPATLGEIHQEACTSIVSTYSQLLHFSQAQTDRLYLKPPEVNHMIHCRELCQDFREDLEFRFSLGIFSLTKWVNTGSIMYSIQRRVSSITAVVPAELLLPISLLGGGIILSRLLSWRYLLPPTLLYVGVYMYEHLTWTDRAKEGRLKKQIMRHLTDKLSIEVLTIKTSFKNVLLTDIQRLLDNLNSAFNSTQKDHETHVSDLTKQEEKITKLKGEIHTLRNKIQLVKTDLDRFKEDYLSNID